MKTIRLKRSKTINQSLMLPMKIVQIYLCSTIILYILGPFEWPTHNSLLFYTFLFMVQFALFFGYKTSMNNVKQFNAKVKNNKRFLRLLKIMIVINLIFIILNATRYTGLSSISFQGLFEKVQYGLLNPFQQYQAKFDTANFGGKILTYSSTLLAPLLWSTLPLSLLYFKKLNILFKLLTIFALLGEAFRWIGTGTNKGVFDLLIICAVVALIMRMQNTYTVSLLNFKKKRKRRGILYFSLLIILGTTYFSNAIGSRVNENWYNISMSTGRVPIEFNSFLMNLCPAFLQPTMIYLASYVCQGYYALSMALTLPWTPMFGVGNSMFLMDKFSTLYGANLYQYTYQSKLQIYGWDQFVNWHSIYVWLANDIHFIGVIPLMFVLGFFFAEITKDAVIQKQRIASVILCLLFIMFFYFPANNQVLSYPSTFMAFWVLSILWVYQRLKKHTTLR